MTRRAIKKLMRKAADAIAAGRYNDAEKIYLQLLNAFENGYGSLIDHAACIYLLSVALDGQERYDESLELTGFAGELLSRYGLSTQAA
jgi:hypothetical protein